MINYSCRKIKHDDLRITNRVFNDLIKTNENFWVYFHTIEFGREHANEILNKFANCYLEELLHEYKIINSGNEEFIIVTFITYDPCIIFKL
jgi:protein involved in ribonucleotide reduction